MIHVNPRLQTAVRFALAGGAIASFGAHAADTTSGAAMEDIVVTGSRIAVPNEVSVSPVIAVTAADIQQSGVTRVEDLLNQLPSVFASQGSNVSNGADGTATVNLRGLGANRNLVLVNGRRLGPGDPRGGSAADLNQIPSELIEKVDVLTGGASSVYGADAVAGVVNFQLNDHFEGFKLSSGYSFYSHTQGDTTSAAEAVTAHNYPLPDSHVNTGFTKDIAAMFGMNTADGKGNATFYATYRNVAAVLQSSYDYSSCSLISGWATSTGKFACGGSSTSYPGRFRQVNPVTGKNISGSETIDANGNIIPYSSAYAYNYGPLNYYQRPDQRWTAGSFMHYEFNEHADVYSEIMYMNDHSVAQIAPSGAFYGHTYTLSCANPFFTAGELSAWCAGSTAGTTTLNIGRRNVEGGPRQDDLEHTSIRIVLGSRGKIDDNWSYDAYAQYSNVQLQETYLNDMSTARIGNALNAIPGPNGTAVCANSAAVGCVPWNIFQIGGVAQQLANGQNPLSYVSVPGVQRGEVDMRIVSANVTGDLGKYGLKVPTAATAPKVNFGVEWRNVQSATTPDEEYQTGDLAGQGAATLPVNGEITSREAFTELNVPLVDDKPFAKSINFQTGYRYSDYDLGFKTNTYKFGLEWTPVNDVRLRGSFARAVRAPNVGELYSIQTLGLEGSVDPCANSSKGAVPTNITAAQCALGNPGAGTNFGSIDPSPAAQYQGIQGGNPNLQPETAITKSFGIGWTPSFLHGFRAQVDWYDINITNVIGAIGFDNILKYCYSSGLYCDQIHRDVNGTLWASPQGYVEDTAINSGGLRQKGIDVDMSYSFGMGKYGKMNVNLIGTYLIAFTETALAAVSGTTYDCVGLYGSNCGQPNQKWRHVMRATWQTPWKGTDVSLAWRYYQGVKLDALSSQPLLRAGSGSDADLIANGYVSNTDAHIGSRSYLDLTASFQVNNALTLRFGVNNLFDKAPPIIGGSDCGSGCNGNTFPQVYDALGRYMFARAVLQF